MHLFSNEKLKVFVVFNDEITISLIAVVMQDTTLNVIYKMLGELLVYLHPVYFTL